MKINSGTLNQKIEIYTYIDGDDGYGGSVPNHVLYWATSANVKPMSSYELTQTGKTDLRGGFTFTLRYRKDKSINEKMILKYRGEDMEIISALMDYVTKETLTIKAIWSNRPVGRE